MILYTVRVHYTFRVQYTLRVQYAVRLQCTSQGTVDSHDTLYSQGAVYSSKMNFNFTFTSFINNLLNPTVCLPSGWQLLHLQFCGAQNKVSLEICAFVALRAPQTGYSLQPSLRKVPEERGSHSHHGGRLTSSEVTFLGMCDAEIDGTASFKTSLSLYQCTGSDVKRFQWSYTVYVLKDALKLDIKNRWLLDCVLVVSGHVSYIYIHSFIHSFIHLVRSKPLPKRALHIVRSRASSFK